MIIYTSFEQAHKFEKALKSFKPETRLGKLRVSHTAIERLKGLAHIKYYCSSFLEWKN